MDTERSAIAIVLKGSKVLVGERRHGALAFPGGYIHRGEEGYQAAARETAEETNVKAKMETIPLNSNRRDKRLFYLGSCVGNDIPKDSWELKNVRWMEIGEALEKLTFSSNRHYLKEVIS